MYFRAHNLLTTGDGTPSFKWGSTNAIPKTPHGEPVYDWTIVDRIIDTYRARGIHPYLQIGFMPEALSTAPAGMPYQHPGVPGSTTELIATGWSYPPKSYEKWGELVYQWTQHNVERYGRAEVEKWYFEVWNEANLRGLLAGHAGGILQAARLSRSTGVRRALPDRARRRSRRRGRGRRIHGWLPRARHARHELRDRRDGHADRFPRRSMPRAGRRFVDGHVRMGISTHLKEVDNGFAKIAAVPDARGQADRDRRERSRRLRRLPGPAERLSQRHDVFELHRGELRAHLGARGAGAA